MGSLFVVGTPIGNLEDISIRAIKTLRSVDLILCEDTRRTKILLKRYRIKKPLLSYHEGNEERRTREVLRLLEEKDIALVSEAGMPGISDPGYRLVRACHEKGIKVIPIPGPSAITSALSVSGLPSNQFIYIGFLPRKKGERRKILKELQDERRTIVAFESPHRLKESLEGILEILGDREIAICREMTKMFEEIFRGKVSDAVKHFSEPRGEFTLIIEGRRE